MLIRKNSEISSLNGTEGTKIKPYFDPQDTQNQIRFSLAEFTLRPKQRSRLHKLQSTEIYFILEGSGKLRINDKSIEVKKDDSILVPSMSEQLIENIGSSDLRFLCIVDPAWKLEDEIILE